MDSEHHIYINCKKPCLFSIWQAMDHLHEHASPQALVLVVVLFLVAVHFATSTSRAEMLLRKLPSPRLKLPIIGHLHLVGSLPHVSLRELARKHGPDVMLLRLGAVPTLIVSSPSAAKAILRTHDHLFASRPPSSAGEILFSGSTNVANAPYGDYWREIRKIVTTHLLTTNKIRSNLASREQEVRLVLAELRKAAAAGTAVDLSELLSSFAHHVEIQTVLGRLPREAGWSRQFHELLEGNSKILGGFNLDDCFPSLTRLDMVSAKVAKHKKRWDNLLDDLIDRHARNPVEEDDDKDFIDVLLSVQVQQEYSLTRDNIKSVLMFY
uniref:Uncharacterized protein n=1 Tax=Avena sativa TaxID=4498 RepID=A0ACD5VJ69_AVESA